MIEKERGALLLAAIFLVVVIGFIGTIVVALVSTQSFTSVNEIRSTEALYVAEGGLERALYAFKNGTICIDLATTSASLGNGNFDIVGTPYNPAATTLSAPIDAVVTTVSVASIAGYAPHGRIQIGSELIDYARASTVAADCAPAGAPCFIGVERGAGGSTAAAHSSPPDTVSQNQCTIQSTGTVTASPGTGERVVEAAAVRPTSSAFSDPVLPTTVGVVETNIGSLATTLPPGDNLIIVVVALNNTGAIASIGAGNLRLKMGAAVLASNENEIYVGGGATPTKNNFPQETQFLLYKDVGAPANPTYDVTAIASAAGLISAEVKMVMINNAPNSSFQDGGSVVIPVAVETTLLTHATTLPAGDNVIIAAVQLENDAGGNTPAIAGEITVPFTEGRLRLKKGATVLAYNQFNITLAKPDKGNEGIGFLLVARDAGAAANPTYTVTAFADDTGLNGEAKIIVMNGLTSAFVDSGLVPISSAGMTPIGTLPTTLPAGEHIVIAANQFINSAGGVVSIAVGDEELALNGATVSENEFLISLCGTNPPPDDFECFDFADGLLYRTATAPASPTYQTQAQATAAGIDGESKIVVINIGGGRSVDWIEVPQ